MTSYVEHWGVWSLPLRAETDTVRRSMTALLVAVLAALWSHLCSNAQTRLSHCRMLRCVGVNISFTNGGR